MALKVIAQPTVEPVNIQEIKSYSILGDDVSDDVIKSLIRTARITAERYQNRSFITQTLELSLDCLPCGIISLPHPPVSALISFKLYDIDDNEYSVDVTDFLLDTASEPARLRLKNSKKYPNITLRSFNSVKIRYTAGYGNVSAVPDDIKDAIKLYVSFRYENPECGDIPDAFYNLLKPERVVNV